MKSFLNLILVCLFVSPVFAKTGNEKSHLVKHQTTVKHSKKQSAPEKTPPTASEVVQKFYQAYMDFKKTKTNKPPQLTFSKSFRELIKKNAKLCKQRAKGDVCGFGADGDIYLDTQDTDEKFSFKTSKFRIFEAEPGDVDVYFDPEPSREKPVGTNDKKIHYKMIEENGKWVVDEIFYDKESARQNIETEMLLLQKN